MKYINVRKNITSTHMMETIFHEPHMVSFRVTYDDFSIYYSSGMLCIKHTKNGTKSIERWASARNIDQLNLSEDDWNVFIFESFM